VINFVDRYVGRKPHRRALSNWGGVRPPRGSNLLRERIPAVGLSSAAPSIEANGGDGDTERQRVTEDRFAK
jgi:hypothetical protein